jgi:hypothetical protein
LVYKYREVHSKKKLTYYKLKDNRVSKLLERQHQRL